MNDGDSEQRTASHAHYELLGSSIPALVHRANNCLSVIDGTLELGAHVDAETKGHAQEQSSILRELLMHLGMHARHDLSEKGEIEFTHLISEVEVLLQVVGRFRRCDTEVFLGVRTASISGDRPQLYRLLVSLGIERTLALYRSGAFGSALRLSFVARGDMGRLLIVDKASTVPVAPHLWESLSSELEGMEECWGYSFSRRIIGNAHAIRIDFPLLYVSEWREDQMPSRPWLQSERILLVQEKGEEADLSVALLSETGYRVEHRESCEGTAEHFDLVLCDETLFSGLTRVVPPVLLIGAALPDPKVLGAVKRPINPQELLDRVGAALLSPATRY